MSTKEFTEEEKRRAFAAAFESLKEGKTPNGEPIDFLKIANENLFRRQKRARESWRRAPPEDLATRRWWG